MREPGSYIGQELVLFENAKRWKRYFASFIKPYVGKRTIEVGPGLGANTMFLNDGSAELWLMPEPDAGMFALVEQKIADHILPANCKATNTTLEGLEPKADYNTILYIDVLEHIANDKAETQVALDLLKPGGYLVILAPAFQSLYSPFDKAIGHFRRYTRSSLKEVVPASLKQVKLWYLDSAAYFLSLSNRLLLKQKYPTQKQVNTWDRFVVPVSGITDRIANYSFGKSILGIWKKDGTD